MAGNGEAQAYRKEYYDWMGKYLRVMIGFFLSVGLGVCYAFTTALFQRSPTTHIYTSIYSGMGFVFSMFGKGFRAGKIVEFCWLLSCVSLVTLMVTAISQLLYPGTEILFLIVSLVISVPLFGSTIIRFYVKMAEITPPTTQNPPQQTTPPPNTLSVNQDSQVPPFNEETTTPPPNTTTPPPNTSNQNNPQEKHNTEPGKNELKVVEVLALDVAEDSLDEVDIESISEARRIRKVGESSSDLIENQLYEPEMVPNRLGELSETDQQEAPPVEDDVKLDMTGSYEVEQAKAPPVDPTNILPGEGPLPRKEAPPVAAEVKMDMVVE